MKGLKALEQLVEISASQWGMITTAQAQRFGVPRINLTRLEDEGKYERMSQGVYRDMSVPTTQYDGIRAAWLSTNPKQTAEERILGGHFDAVVSRESAAWLLNVGDFLPEPYRFTMPERRQTQRTDVRFYRKTYPSQSVIIREGLPVTTFEQTVADLVEARADLSLVSDMFTNRPFDHPIDRERLVVLLSPLAARNGYKPGDGQALYDQLSTQMRKQLLRIARAIINGNDESSFAN